MNQLLDHDTAPGLLARVREARRVEEQAARDTFLATAEFLAASTVTSVRDGAVLAEDSIAYGHLEGGQLAIDGFWEHSLPLTGEGAPLIAESAVVEFTAALGYSAAGGRAYLADVVESAWRLPRIWDRVQAGTVAVWRVRRIAAATRDLSPDVAAYVDQHVARQAHKIGCRQLDRIIAEATALYEPDVTAAAAEEAIAERRFDIDTNPALFHTSTPGAEQGNPAASNAQVYGTLDAADAADLEAAVATIAHELLDHDTTADLPLGARRAAALGVMARAYNTGTMPQAPGIGRVVELVIHTDTPDLAGSGLVRNQATRGLATIEQLDRWATLPGVTIRPVVVVDLAEEITTDAYRPTPRQRRQAALIHATCAHPGCTVRAEDCDLDHRIPYDQGGRTTTSNLTPLCRKHHRAKTHLGWSYERLGPGVYLWHSPQGYRYITTRDGTIDVLTRHRRHDHPRRLSPWGAFAAATSPTLADRRTAPWSCSTSTRRFSPARRSQQERASERWHVTRRRRTPGRCRSRGTRSSRRTR